MSYFEFSNKEVKNRKKTRCNWCGQDVNIGDKSKAVNGVYDNRIFYYHFHPECSIAMEEYFKINKWDDEYEPMQYKRGSVEER